MPRSTKRQHVADSERSTEAVGDHFAQIPLSLLNDQRQEVTAYVRLVYAAIHSYCTFGTTAGAYPTDEQLAARMGCSPRQVRRARERLRALGYVFWKTGSKRYRQANEYTLYPRGDGPGKPDFNTAPQAGMRRSEEEEDEFITAPQAASIRPHRPDTPGPTGRPYRTKDIEPKTEKYRGKTPKCSHADTAFCSHCLTATAPSRDHVNADDEDF